MQSQDSVLARICKQQSLLSTESVLDKQSRKKTDKQRVVVGRAPLNVINKCRLLTLFLIPAILNGCGIMSITPVNGAAAYVPKQARIQTPVFLEITQETKGSVTDAKYLGAIYRVPTGKILEVNAPNAFDSIFDSVVTEASEEKPGYSVSVIFTPDTRTNLGAFTFSKNTFTTVLQCDIKSADNQVIWSKTVETESSGRRALKAVAQTAVYTPLYESDDSVAYPGKRVDAYAGALQDAANDSVARALWELTNEIHKARDSIFSRDQ